MSTKLALSAQCFPLETVKGVYGKRKETDKKRVFIMTRSAFAGL